MNPPKRPVKPTPARQGISLKAPVASANTLRLQGASLQRLLDDMDLAVDKAASAAAAAKRDYRRWSIRDMGDVQVDMHQPGGTVTSLRYVCRDLSGSGMGILHSAFVYPGTRCVAHVAPGGAGKPRPVPGTVTRCRLTGKGVHEIGIQFRQPITVGEFVNINPFEGKFSLEKIDAAGLRGSVLHIDSPMDRKLLRHHLEETQLNVVSAANGTEGIERASERFDLIVCEAQLVGMSGFDLCRSLRSQGVHTPVLMVSAHTEHSAEEAKAAGANGFLRKPFTKVALLAAAAEFLLLAQAGPDGAGPIYSTIAPEDPLMKFVPEFITELQGTANRLSKAVAASEVETVRMECFQVMGAAASLGLGPIGMLAQRALRITGTKSLKDSARAVNDLILACRRVRVREAA